MEDELSMKDSLAAVRNAAQAAARIQNAICAFSFRKRQQKTARLKDEYGMTQEDIDELAAASRLYHQAHASSGQFYDKAAVSIQKKYKGWKGRKHFLNMRRNAVKIQAHVRGHQVRKKYRTIVSTASVLEKVILRWRRKGHGLRGFRAEQQPMVEAIEEDDEEDDDFDDDEAVKVFRRQKVDHVVKEAVSRVMSMVDSTEARMQYRRMLEELERPVFLALPTFSSDTLERTSSDSGFVLKYPEKPELKPETKPEPELVKPVLPTSPVSKLFGEDREKQLLMYKIPLKPEPVWEKPFKMESFWEEREKRLFATLPKLEPFWEEKPFQTEPKFMQAEELLSTPYKDVMAWFAIGKQRQIGRPSHICMQKAGQELLLGRDDIRQKVMEKILLDSNAVNNCTAISIYGWSGLGKT